MFISADKIIELIEIAKECDRKLPEDEKRIHVLDIAATLQKLIDDEVAEMDKMAEYFQAEEDERLNQQAIRLEDEEWGRLQMEEAAIEKELLIDFNWPGGL
jgi:hypothetical protein